MLEKSELFILLQFYYYILAPNVADTDKVSYRNKKNSAKPTIVYRKEVLF